MREIKFRGQRVTDGEWAYGDYFNAVSGLTIIEDGGESPTSFAFVDPETIGQLYEHKDKSGNDIYEGDIIETVYEKSGIGSVKNEIRFTDGAFCWIGENTGKAYRLEKSDCKGATVIGNIHDNPTDTLS